MYSMKRILISALIAGLVCAGEAALFATATAAAELPQPQSQQSVKVRFTDLNLERPADVAQLYHRIRAAAQSACGPRDLELTNWVDPDWRRCVDTAVAQAVGRVDRPALSAYHQRRLGQSPAA